MDTQETGVPGLDRVLGCGIPKGYTVLVGGVPGAGKTILTSQIGFHRARRGGRVLMLSALAESTTKLAIHLSQFSFFAPELMGDAVQILDLQRLLTTEGVEATLGAIRTMVLERRAELVILDTLRGLDTLIGDHAAVHGFLHGLGVSLFALGCTTVLQDDRITPGAEVSAEQTLADAVIALEVLVRGRRELRRLRVVKVRGARPLTGKHTYAITGDGIHVHPRIESLPAVPQAPPISDERLSWGVPGLDALTGGGVPAYDATLLGGPSGMGKTTMGLQFVAAGVAAGERCLYLTFHETREELLHKAAGFGMDLRGATESGALRFQRFQVEQTDVDDVLHALLADIEHRAVGRVVIDSLNPLERDAADEGRFTNMLAALASMLRHRRATALMLREMMQLIAQDLDLSDGREVHWMPLENIVLLRPVEIEGSLGRIISVLKMRNSAHDARIHGFAIGERGLEVAGVLEGLQGLLTGLPRRDG